MKQSILHFVHLGIILVLSSATDVMAAGCKNMIWLPMKSGKYLRHHGIQNMTVSSQSMCRIMCYLSEKTCLSYNFHQSTSTCEINDSDEFQHPDDLIPMNGYSYTSAENGCQSNPCPSNSTGCQADFTTKGGYKCLCQSGFAGPTCSDVDECTTGQHNCSVNATCTNIVGSFNCTCNDGYFGNGTNCNDVDECTTGQHNCSVNATCTNIAGSFNCMCMSGYSGDGTHCTDVDECTTGQHNCSVNATCTNMVGSFNCKCKDGFLGNGRSCNDIDECTTGQHNCSVNATCTNMAGSFNCMCKSGYSGDGTHCTDVDECTTGHHNCSVNATCTNMVGSFNCRCKDGFLGNGRSCNDIDECTTGQHNCSVNATCTNMAGSFNCKCKSGYSGDGSNCIKLPAGTKDNPAKSCLEILNAGDSHGTGDYWIDPANTGSPIPAFCDMTTDGGGWTVVRKLVQPNHSPPLAQLFDTYDVIKHYNRTDVNVIPRGAAMLDIKNKMGFQQIHFYCRKVNVGRVVSIMTKNNTAGHEVVRYFTSPGTATRPTACDTFDVLSNDTSVLSQNCNQWGDSNEGKWGGSCCYGPMRIVAMVAHIGSTNGFECSIYFSCDNAVPDDANLAVPPDAGDIWQISVR